MNWNYITLVHQKVSTGPPSLNRGINLSCDSRTTIKKSRERESSLLDADGKLCEGLSWLVLGDFRRDGFADFPICRAQWVTVVPEQSTSGESGISFSFMPTVKITSPTWRQIEDKLAEMLLSEEG